MHFKGNESGKNYPMEIYSTSLLRAKKFYSNVDIAMQVASWDLGATVTTIQFSSPVDFNTLPVDCRNFLALTAVLLCCLLW